MHFMHIHLRHFLILIGFFGAKYESVSLPRVQSQSVQGQIPYWTKFRRTKYFVGQNFQHQAEISTVLSDEFLSDKVVRCFVLPTP